MLTFYDGHLVLGQNRAGMIIGIVPSEDGLRKLAANTDLVRLLEDTSICGKSFEYHSDFIGSMFVCKADNANQWQLDLDVKDIAETLRTGYDFHLLIIEGRYCRLVTDLAA